MQRSPNQDRKSDQQGGSNVGQAIVAFIDILGYEALVTKFRNNLTFIEALETVLEKYSVGLVNTLSDIDYDKPTDKTHMDSILQIMSVRFVSDTVLFTLPISEITSSPHFSKKEAIRNSIFVFFRSIIAFSTSFIGKTGHVLRGGIASGAHYENVDASSNSFFIFSEAYIKAYHLEKLADNPRIVIDKELWSFLRKISFFEVDNCFYEDRDGRKCLDIYHVFRHNRGTEKVLTDIKQGLLLNLRQNIGKQKELRKLKSFAEFHNSRVSKEKLNYENLTIDMHTFQ